MTGRKLNNLPAHVQVHEVGLTDENIPTVELQFEEYNPEDPNLRFETYELEGAMPQDVNEILEGTDMCVEVFDYLYETAEVGDKLPL